MSRRKRLCMVVHGPYPDPRVVREVRTALDAGFEVDVVAMADPGEARRSEVDGARVYRIPHLRLSRSGPVSLVREYTGFTLLAIFVVAKLHLGRLYDVVQVHNPPDFLVAAAVIPRVLGARIVLDVHDLAPELFAMRLGSRRWAGAVERILRIVESAAIRVSDSVVTVHEPYRRELLARGVPDDKIVVVLNALDERLVPAGPPPSEDGAFRVVYHGTVTPHYGVDLLVDAFATVADAIPGARLEIYGPGDAVPAVRERVEEHGVTTLVHVDGRSLPQKEVLRRVCGASVGVVSLLPIERNRAALPSKLLEYVALGIPVIAPDIPAIVESFSENEIAYFQGGDVYSLAEAIRSVAADPAAARSRAELAMERYRAAYSWPIYAERYVELLESLARSSRLTDS
jgi:glycosyltransferase involved in cell wall biosynthesis